MIKFKIIPYKALCSLKTFTVNGKEVRDPDEFFSQDDIGSEYAEDYACGNMQGTAAKSTPEILEYYGITEEEFNKIAEEAAEAVSFGECGWCV